MARMSKYWRDMGLRGMVPMINAKFEGMGIGYPQEPGRRTFHLRFSTPSTEVKHFNEAHFNMELTPGEMKAIADQYRKYLQEYGE